MTESKIHIGKLIREQLKERERSVAWLARKVNCDASNLSKLLKKADINTSLLLRISKVLQYDFFTLYSEEVYEDL